MLPTFRYCPTRLALLALLPVLGCADNGQEPTAIPPPAHLTHALSGSVTLLADLTDELGNATGVQRIGNAEGIRVYCRHGGSNRDSAMTVSGRFEFPAVHTGRCTLEVRIGGPQPASQLLFDMPEHDHEMTGGWELSPTGDLRIYPNPAPHEGSGIEFTMAAAQTYRVTVRTLSGDPVWSFEQTAPPGFYHVHWAGSDAQGEHVDDGPYWVVAEFDGTVRVGIVLWGADHGSPDPGNCGHIEADGLVLAHHGEALVTCWRGDCQGELHAAAGETSHAYSVTFLQADSTAFAIADSCPDNHLTWTLADSTIASVRLDAGKKWEVRVIGKKAGTTEFTLEGWHEGHVHFTSPAIPIVVE